MRPRLQSKTVSGAPGQFLRSRSPSYSPGPSPDRPLVHMCRPFASNLRTLPLCSSATTMLPSARRTAPVTLPKMYSTGPSTIPIRTSGSSASLRSGSRGARLSTISCPLAGAAMRAVTTNAACLPRVINGSSPCLAMCTGGARRSPGTSSVRTGDTTSCRRVVRRVDSTPGLSRLAGARYASGTSRRWLPHPACRTQEPTSSPRLPLRAPRSRVR